MAVEADVCNERIDDVAEIFRSICPDTKDEGSERTGLFSWVFVFEERKTCRYGRAGKGGDNSDVDLSTTCTPEMLHQATYESG